MDEIISKFKSIDLSTYPEDEIRELFAKIGDIGYIVVTFHHGKSVMRARPGGGFIKKSDYSFKPQEFNTTYQRASTPNETMFYATSIPEKINEGELENMRIIGVAETIPMLRDTTSSGYQKISFGRWLVNEDINLIAIVHEKDYYNRSNYTKELVDAYNKFIKNVPDEIVNRSLKFQDFLASEFSKEDIQNDYDYMISAIFSKLVVEQGYDGVIYPSVRVGGEGFNIAITQKATKKMSLIVAGECSIYKLKKHTVIGNDTIVELKGTEEEFELKPIVPNQQNECLRQLGVETLDEIINAE